MEEQTLEELKSQLILNRRDRRWIAESWNTSIESLLKCFGEKSAASAKLHLNASNHYNRVSNIYSYTYIIFSTIAGTTGFSSTNRTVIFLIACLNIVSALIGSFQKFARPEKKSEKHRQTSVDFSKLYRAITMELSIDRDERMDAVEALKKYKTEYDRVLSNSDHVPRKITDRFNTLYKDRENNPDQCNGLSSIIVNSPDFVNNSTSTTPIQEN